MQKPQMPNVPGAGAMNDPMEFVRNLWGSMSVPGMGTLAPMAPPMSVEDLDKKIADLKAVETWLNLNLSMLRGTIQTLEIQRGTMVTLRSMSAAMAAAVKQPEGGAAAAPYAAFFAQPPAQPPAPEVKAEPKPEAKIEAPKDPLPAAAAAAMANPTAWWTMLQDQFKQAVASTMSPEAVAKAQEAAAAMGGMGAKAAPGESDPAASNPTEKADSKRAPAKRAPKARSDGS